MDIDERDVQALMQALFDIKSDVQRIRELLEEDDGEEEEEVDS